MNFTLDLSTRIYFGTKIVAEALEKEKGYLGKRIMIVTTGRSLVSNGYVDQLKTMIRGVSDLQELIVFENISANPKLEEVKEAVLVGKEKQVDMIIGFGGGSAMDAAKAVAVGVVTDDLLEEYLLNAKEPPEDTLPIIAIPTTAGTGSELSKGAIITSSFHKVKTGIRGKNIQPKVAIVDSSYTWSIPFKITMETGFDVLAHAIESYLAIKSNYYSEMLSECAIKIVAKELPRLKNDLKNENARERMAYASMLMGMNLATTGTCLPHRMQYAIGSVSDTSHAAGLLALYPAWMYHEYEVSREKVQRIITWLGRGDALSADDVKCAIEDFLSELGVHYSLRDLGIRKEMIGELAGRVTGNINNDKLAQDKDIVRKIFEESLN